MSDHEQESRELETSMERALAVAVAHAASLVESWARLAANRARRRGEEPTAIEAPTAAIAEAQDIQARARGDLVVGAKDARYWQSASPEEMAQKIRDDTGIEPTALGSRTHDRHWAERAKGAEVIGLLDVAERYAEQSAVAAAVRDNLGDLIRDYGLDPDELMRSAPEEAAERYTQSRAEFYAPTPQATTDRDHLDGDAVTVSTLLSQAQAADMADRDAREQSAIANDRLVDAPSDRAAAGPSTAEVNGPAATRAETVTAAVAVATPARDAAATAARDHPTNPRAATASRRQPRARRTTSAASTGRERGRTL